MTDPTIKAPPSTERSHGRGKQFMHDALVAGFVTLVTVIAFDLGLFADFDGRLFAEVSEWVSKIDPRRTDQALTLEIDQRTFENRFGGRTPLDRTELAKIVEAVSNTHDDGQPGGRTLAIDLDLSPRGEDLAEFNLSNCANLDDKAKTRWPIEHALCTSKLERIVLLAPFPTDGEQAVQKLRWMTFVCNIVNEVADNVGFANKVDFALAYIPPPVGSYSVEYYTKASTLAGVVAGEAGLCEKVVEHRQQPVETASARAQPAGVPIDLGFLLRSVAGANQENLPVQYLGAKPDLLNFRLDAGSVPLSTCATDGPGGELDRYTLDLKECDAYRRAAALRRTVLFLGGTWDATGADEFFTPIGRIPGVRLHALAYAGRELEERNQSGSIQTHKVVALIVEFVVGLGLIVLFRLVWRVSDRALDGVIPAWKSGDRLAGVRATGVYLSSVLVVPAIVALIALLLLGALAVALSSYVWMGPTALLVSLLAKSYIERPDRGFTFPSFAWWWEHVPHLLVALYGLVIMIPLLTKG